MRVNGLVQCASVCFHKKHLLNRDLQGAGEAAVTPFVRISRVSADGKEAVVGTGEMR